MTLNGNPIRLVYDTGAINAISAKQADSLGINMLSEIQMADANNKQSTLKLTKIDSVKIDKAYFKNQGFGIYDFSFMNEFNCFGVDGIIGANMFKNSICQIYMLKKVLIITNNRELLNLANTEIQLPFKSGVSSSPYIQLRVNNTMFDKVYLDYGSNYGIDLVVSNETKDTVAAGDTILETYGISNFGAMGSSMDTTYSFKPDLIKSGNYQLDNQIVSCRKKGVSTIGKTVLEDYIVTLDWIDNMVYLKPQDIKKGLNENLETFGLKARLINDKIIVQQIIKGSSAYQQGIQLGDEIISINQKDLTNSAQKDYCEIYFNGLFPNNMQKAVVEYKRNNKTFTKTLKKTKLL